MLRFLVATALEAWQQDKEQDEKREDSDENKHHNLSIELEVLVMQEEKLVWIFRRHGG
jgi:hypothetical protein